MSIATDQIQQVDYFHSREAASFCSVSSNMDQFGVTPDLNVYMQTSPVPQPGYTVMPGYAPPGGAYAAASQPQQMQGQQVQQGQKGNCDGDWRCGKNIWGACLPLLIFVILAIISLVITIFTPGTGRSKILNIVVSSLWYLLWGFIIYMLCRAGHPGWAWVVLFLPLIIWAILTILIFIGWIVIESK